MIALLAAILAEAVFAVVAVVAYVVTERRWSARNGGADEVQEAS